MPEKPTVFHWHRAAQQGIFSEILLVSNFDGRGPAAVGSYPALGPVGTYDMAGNVRERCVNRTGDRRHILSGACSEPLGDIDEAFAGWISPSRRAKALSRFCASTRDSIRFDRTTDTNGSSRN